MFGKYFASTFTGSMVGAGINVFAVWGYVIANTRSDGYVELNPPILAAMIGCEVSQIESAIAFLMAPDPNSRSKKNEGSRLVQTAPFLFFVPNHADYRAIRDDDDRREYMANYMREYRAKKPSKSVNVNVNKRKPRLAYADTESESESDTEADFKRLINACVSENSKINPKIVEIGMLYTMIQRNGSKEKIKSLKYFTPEITRIAQDSVKLSEQAIDTLLECRRKQFWKEKGWKYANSS